MSLAALASALSGGAVSFVARLIKAATHPFVIINEIRSAYRGLAMSEVSEVYWQGMGAYSSAQEIASQPPTSLIPAEDLSLNPHLFGQNPQGYRLQYGILGRYQVPGETDLRYVQFNIKSDFPMSEQELFDLWESKFDALEYDTSRRIGATQTQGIQPLGIEVLYAERRF